MTRNILLVIIIVLLLWNAVILCDIRLALYNTVNAQINKSDMHQEKNELPKKPGKLIPNPRLPQWSL